MKPRLPHFARDGHVPRKRFGQNFLHDTGLIRSIVEAVNPAPQDRLVEIGPGLGALSMPLLKRVTHLEVVEIDRDLIARLKERETPGHLTIHECDALAFDFGRLGGDLRIVGNLPYNISTPLLFHLAGFAKNIRDLHLMLQKEVAVRMAAPPGSTVYGRLSVMLQHRFYLYLLFDVPPESFDPAPKVLSSVVRMIPKPAQELLVQKEEFLARVVTAAFSQRRKMLRNTLKPLFNDDELRRLSILPELRAEDLSLADFARLANCLCEREKGGV